MSRLHKTGRLFKRAVFHIGRFKVGVIRASIDASSKLFHCVTHLKSINRLAPGRQLLETRHLLFEEKKRFVRVRDGHLFGRPTREESVPRVVLCARFLTSRCERACGTRYSRRLHRAYATSVDNWSRQHIRGLVCISIPAHCRFTSSPLVGIDEGRALPRAVASAIIDLRLSFVSSENVPHSRS